MAIHPTGHAHTCHFLVLVERTGNARRGNSSLPSGRPAENPPNLSLQHDSYCPRKSKEFYEIRSRGISIKPIFSTQSPFPRPKLLRRKHIGQINRPHGSHHQNDGYPSKWDFFLSPVYSSTMLNDVEARCSRIDRRLLPLDFVDPF